jgi:uncharacterized metal-binding protein
MAEICSEKALEKANEIYDTDEEVKKAVEVCNELKAEGKGQWTRIQEILSYTRHMGYEKIGLAHCAGFKKEAETLAEIFAGNGVELSTVSCSLGRKGCNTIGQAMILNEAGMEFNIVMGLCMGHDVLFQKFSEAPTTVLVIKDRAASHNPIAPLRDESWCKKLSENAFG